MTVSYPGYGATIDRSVTITKRSLIGQAGNNKTRFGREPVLPRSSSIQCRTSYSRQDMAECSQQTRAKPIDHCQNMHSRPSKQQEDQSVQNRNHLHHQHRRLLSPTKAAPATLASAQIAAYQKFSPTLSPHDAAGENKREEETTKVLLNLKKAQKQKSKDISAVFTDERRLSSHAVRLWHRSGPKSTSSSTSSPVPQPVIVRMYSPEESRASSHARLSSSQAASLSPPVAAIDSVTKNSSSISTFLKHFAPISLRGAISAPLPSHRATFSKRPSETSQVPEPFVTPLPSPAASATRFAIAENSRMPSIDAFLFQNVIQAVEPDIQPALDAIAEIYSRSKMSLADEYSAHLPPQGEIIYGITIGGGGGAGAGGTRHPYRFGNAAQDGVLPVLHEASSSSEKLAVQGKLKQKTTVGRSENIAKTPEPYCAQTSLSISTLDNEFANMPDADTQKIRHCSSISLMARKGAHLAAKTSSSATTVSKIDNDASAANGHFIIVSTDKAKEDRRMSQPSIGSWITWNFPSNNSVSHSPPHTNRLTAETKLKDILRSTVTDVKNT